jgi:hypothetical protein
MRQQPRHRQRQASQLPQDTMMLHVDADVDGECRTMASNPTGHYHGSQNHWQLVSFDA